MSAVSEEDVLAVLLLWACRPVVTNVHASEQIEERWAYDAATAGYLIGTTPGALIARARMDALKSIEEAIADSERRWSVECAEREVLVAAERWFDGTPLDSTAEDLMDALARLARVR